MGFQTQKVSNAFYGLFYGTLLETHRARELLRMQQGLVLSGLRGLLRLEVPSSTAGSQCVLSTRVPLPSDPKMPACPQHRLPLPSDPSFWTARLSGLPHLQTEMDKPQQLLSYSLSCH